MSTGRRTCFLQHPCRRAAISSATPFHFLLSRGTYHDIPPRQISVQEYANSLRRVGYIVMVFSPAPLSADPPDEGHVRIVGDLQYFLPPNADMGFLHGVRPTPPNYAAVILGNILIISCHP